MAPKTKREATPEQSDEVCKRLKDELKTEAREKSPAGDPPVTKEQDSKEESATNNNNNNNNNEPDSVTKGPTNGSNVKTDQTDTPTTNGDKKVDAPSEEANGPAAATNGDKHEPETHEVDKEPKDDKKGTSETKVDQEEPEEEESEEETPIGTLLMCGGANWDMTGRKELPKTAKKPAQVDPAARNLWSPHRVTYEGKNLRVSGVFSGCNACHSVIVTEDGLTLTFGRNDKGQLGLGDTETRITPVVVEALKGINVVAAACGRSHTLFLDADGIVYACGDNKMGQCGTNQMAVQQLTTPARIAFKENKPIVKMACGAEFSMIVDDEGRLYSFGHPEHGQLGHNSEGKYFTSGNKYAFHCEYAPRRVVTFIEKNRDNHISPVDDVFITDVACGTNHTLVVDKNNRCFSWGFAGYHRLGHQETKNELVPRSLKNFDAPKSSGRGAVRVFAGATHSMAIDMNGLLYFWGQNKSSGEATMYPKNVQDLCGWRVTSVSCANRSIFVVADNTCISWGPSPTYGELGYGEGKSKSSTTPQEVKTLEGLSVMNVACGFGHTLIIARDDKPQDQTALSKLPSWP